MENHRTTTLSRTAIICVLLSCVSFDSTTTKDKSIFENNVKNIFCDDLGCGHLPPNPKYDVPTVRYNCGSSLEQATCSSDTSVRARPRQPDSFLGTPTLKEHHKEYKNFPLYDGINNNSVQSLPIEYTVLHRYPKPISIMTDYHKNANQLPRTTNGFEQTFTYSSSEANSISRSNEITNTIGKSKSFSTSLQIAIELLLDLVTLGAVSSFTETDEMSETESIVESYTQESITSVLNTIETKYTNNTKNTQIAGYEQRMDYIPYLYEEYDISYTSYLINRHTTEGTLIGRIPTYTLRSTKLLFEEITTTPYTKFMVYEYDQNYNLVPLFTPSDVIFIPRDKQ